MCGKWRRQQHLTKGKTMVGWVKFGKRGQNHPTPWLLHAFHFHPPHIPIFLPPSLDISLVSFSTVVFHSSLIFFLQSQFGQPAVCPLPSNNCFMPPHPLSLLLYPLVFSLPKTHGTSSRCSIRTTLWRLRAASRAAFQCAGAKVRTQLLPS